MAQLRNDVTLEGKFERRESMTYYMFTDMPAGRLLLTSDGSVITGMYWEVFKRRPQIKEDWIESEAPFEKLRSQLSEYFAGERQRFTIVYHFGGTLFQRQVWQELEKIPFGQYTSYAAIAAAIGVPGAMRAVGTAVGSNPISILVPCHRVLSSRGKISGYAGGLYAKEQLLTVENIEVHI
jgi:methylated-DNA-[protein]-cysteine S-methyltransferase